MRLDEILESTTGLDDAARLLQRVLGNYKLEQNQNHYEFYGPKGDDVYLFNHDGNILVRSDNSNLRRFLNSSSMPLFQQTDEYSRVLGPEGARGTKEYDTFVYNENEK